MISALRWVGQGKRAEDGGPAPATPPHLEGRADQARAIGHRVQTDPVAERRLLGHAHAIVADAQQAILRLTTVLRLAAQSDLDPRPPAVSRSTVVSLSMAC